MAATATIHHGVRNAGDVISVRGKRRLAKVMTAIGVFFAAFGCFFLIVLLLPGELVLGLLLLYAIYSSWHTAELLVA